MIPSTSRTIFVFVDNIDTLVDINTRNSFLESFPLEIDKHGPSTSAQPLPEFWSSRCHTLISPSNAMFGNWLFPRAALIPLMVMQELGDMRLIPSSQLDRGSGDVHAGQIGIQLEGFTWCNITIPSSPCPLQLSSCVDFTAIARYHSEAGSPSASITGGVLTMSSFLSAIHVPAHH
jgi:hypothetical protein